MLPQYEIKGFLGRGGMGAVYRGRQVRLDRDVAIKVLPETLIHGGNDELKFAERFELEAKAMAKFNHPSIVSVFDFGETSEGQLYFVMEFVEGMDIHRYLQENGGSISQEYALSITAHVLDALEYAHSRGIIHRDIKPANVLLNTEGQVKIADFGLAKALIADDEHETPALTMSNVALGTPDFVAPEALDGDAPPDHRADLYAVGVMLYQMLTGRIPRGQFPKPSTLLADLDPRIDEIVEQAMQYYPDDRYPSANSMRAALDPVISAPISRLQTIEPKETPSAKPSRIPKESSTAPRKKAGKPWLIYATVAVALFVGALFLILGKREPSPPPPSAEAPRPAATKALTDAVEAEAPGNEGQAAEDGRLSSVAESGQTEQIPETPAAIAASDATASAPLPAAATSRAAEAAQDAPYENSLGMRFAPVPIIGGPSEGRLVLFSLWETRVKDFDAFKRANPEIQHGAPRFAQDESHPAVHIDYANAVAFCEWLTELERANGQLDEGQRYRLPTDHEWSCAIGIGHLEDPDATPKSKDKALPKVWPWGEVWPPPAGLINAYGEEAGNTDLDGRPKYPIPNYSDPFPFTAPVDSLGSGRFGLFHLGGNVNEWTSDWEDETETRRVARGGDWSNVPGNFFLSSARAFLYETASIHSVGFRVVLDLNQAAPPEATLPGVTSTSMERPDAAAASAGASDPDGTAQTEVSPLISIPGLQTRLDGYLAARRGQLTELATRYGDGLDSRLDQAADAGDLALSTAFAAEKERVSGLVAFLEAPPADPVAEGGALPVLPELTELEELPSDAPEGLVGLRQVWDREAEAIIADLDGKLSQSLQALEAELTRAREFEQAKSVLAFRESLEQEGGEEVAVAAAAVAAPDSAAATGSGAASPPPSDLPSATKDAPFVNSLGMKFVPVPGTEVLFCIHETRYKDYEEYAKGRDDVNGRWKALANLGFEIERGGEDHPVTQMNWDDAQRFCAWLSEKEGRTYRLPTDREWSLAVGIGHEEDWKPDTTPATVFKPQNAFPWGDEWPPPPGAGNYSDESRRALAPSDNATYLDGYDDGFPTTAPVMSFEPNELGLFDLGGNVWEWCEDWYSVEQNERVMRGGSWNHRVERVALLSSARLRGAPGNRSGRDGFRVVLAGSEAGLADVSGPPDTMPPAPGVIAPPSTGAAAPQAPDPDLAKATKEAPYENSLGMKFVPIEVDGETILLSVYETTVANYRRFIRQDRKRDWPQPSYRLGDQQAATMMTWLDAEAFCQWLTQEERRKELIGDNATYTLPSLLELQTATGVVLAYDRASGRTTYATQYLWGDEWPIPGVVGNLYGEENLRDPIGSRTPISGYNDGETRIADVGSYEANQFGVHDLIGNAMEFCSNWFNRDEDSKMIFGGSWVTDGEQSLRAGFRNRVNPTMRSSANGFRVVLRRSSDPESSQ